MMKHKRFSFIHIFGLVMGIASSLFILGYVQDEMKIDQSHPNKARVYRVNTDIDTGESILQLSVASGAMGPAMLNDFPEVEAYLRLSRPWSPLLVKKENERHFESKVIYADPGFFSFFGYSLKTGTESGALEGPGKVILTETLAMKYFGSENPVGEQLLIKELPYLVTAVLAKEQLPAHLEFDMLISFDSWVREFTTTETNWGWSPTNTYVMLVDKAASQNLQMQLPAFVEKYMSGPNQGAQMDLSLTSLSDLYFQPARLGDIGKSGDKKQLYLLLSAALLIIVLAISNFVNLSSARAAERMKEVGVRKVVGAHRRQLTYQFFTESVLYAVLSTMLAVGLVILLWPSFLSLIDKEINLATFFSPQTLVGLLGASMLVGLLAGAYPALLLSSYRPVEALKSKSLRGRQVVSPRKVMLTFQFFISMGLLIISLAMWKQFLLIENRELGFYKDRTLVVDLGQDQEVIRKYELIKNELLNTGYLSGLSFSSHVPGDKPHSITTFITKKGEQLNAEIRLNVVDCDFIKNYGLELVAGRDFSKTIATDTAGSLILNEAALEAFGISNAEEAIGLNTSQWGRQGKVIGVVKDFNQESLHSEIAPMSFQVWPAQFQKVSMKVSTENLRAALPGLESTWRDLTASPFNYSFLDDQLGDLYAADERFGKIFRLFTLLSLTITCLGLVSFAAFVVRLKMKEMAIRKVLGALPSSLILRLTAQFWLPALLALALAAAPSYLFLKDWLGQFAYQIDLGISDLLVPVLILLTLVVLSICIQSLSAIRENPIKHLRNE